MPRILIAGNDSLIMPECRHLLEAKGYTLKYCTNLPEALGQVLEDPPDLLVTEKGFSGKNDEVELIQAVKTCLQKANIPIFLVVDEIQLQVELDWDHYPVDDIITRSFIPEILLARIRLAESRMARAFDNNPLSRLPGNTSIIRAIQRVLREADGYAVCYVDIDNFKPYNDRYGFSRGDEVILMVARVVANVVAELARKGSFVGHIGGDDFVFIVREEMVEPVCQKILTNFDLVRNMFLSAEDIAMGEFVGRDRQNHETRFGLLSLSIAAVTTGGGRYSHYGEVSSAASQLKHCVKKLDGSNYLVDRRNT
ncbi:MAG: diguanylate cyclase response regulator [Deltaproteobacteria bacterium RIFOXYD12_FULL_55_16]|nr:MAG: diguanylate cyclase response regulator [Deltaproteobacteria bacterium RIFOXYD12_FULL_55_16]